jgi:hypothetical protein
VTRVEPGELRITQTGNRSGAIRCAVDGCVVDDDDRAIATTTNVQLDSSSPSIQSLAKTSQRVFAEAGKTGAAAVSKHPHLR